MRAGATGFLVADAPEAWGNEDLQVTTIWSFPDRGDWATHRGDYPGNWSPQVPRNVILRYSKPGDLVLDCFLGSGTTLVEARILGRRGLGSDISPKAIAIAQERVRVDGSGEVPKIRVADARDLSFISNDSVDLICTHPPYANIIQYSPEPGDLSQLTVPRFLDAMTDVARELFRILRPNGHCAILMGDTRHRRHVQPLGFWTMERFISAGFVLREIAIKQQHNCRATAYWRQKSITLNFLLLAHEYLFIFRKA